MVLDQVRNNFEEPNSFVGRERELAELNRLAASMRAVTLCGPGGIGKTRLALRVLAGLADDFPDGVWFVELGDLRQPELVVSRVASVIGVDEEPGRPLLETLADALRPRRLLLALDTCEHLIESCARLCHRLLAGSPGLHVLATSREPLRMAAEAVWQVPPLSLPQPGVAGTPEELCDYEAVRLFGDRAEASLPGFALDPANVSAVTALCRSLDGVPLAIELAAAWVRALSVEQILTRLDDRFRLLVSGDRTAPPRQRTLRAAIDWSHDLLDHREQVLLRRLSAFAGWSLEMAEQICPGGDLQAGEILDLLAALVGKSLVVVDTPAHGQARYRMLDTIREYTAARLAEAGETAMMRHRLRDYALRETERLMSMAMTQVRAPWSVTVETFYRFDADRGNLRQVLSDCLAEEDAETGLRLCAVMSPVWIVRGTFAEGAEWFDSFFGLGGAPVPDAVRGPALVGRAQLALASDPEPAQARAAAGLELCRAAGQDFWTAAALNLLTEAALHAGQAEQGPGHSPLLIDVAHDRERGGAEPLRFRQVAAQPGHGGHGAQGVSLVPPVPGPPGGRQGLVAAGRGLLGLAGVQRGLGEQVEGGRRPEILAGRLAQLQPLRGPRLRGLGVAGQGELSPPDQGRAPHRGRHRRAAEAEEGVEPLGALGERAPHDPDGCHDRAHAQPGLGVGLGQAAAEHLPQVAAVGVEPAEGLHRHRPRGPDLRHRHLHQPLGLA